MIRPRKIDFQTDDLSQYRSNDLKKIADYWFRQYLLSKAERNAFGKIYCPLKKKWYSEQDLHVCHFIDRVKTNLRYEENNCILCSKESNTFDAQVRVEGYRSAHHRDFEAYLGDEVVEFLKKESKKFGRYDKNSYIALIKQLKKHTNLSKNN